MIARLTGRLVDRTPERIVVDVQGVGYEVRVPLSTYGALPADGEVVELLIHTHVREDSLALFGFATARERALFEKMISVSGVGPKIAMALLSGLTPAELAEAIRSGSAVTLCRIPGVGRKTAERLVVDLRDKVDSTSESAWRGRAAGDRSAPEGERPLLEDVFSALVNLGYSQRQAEEAVEHARRSAGVDPGPGGEGARFDGLFREALRVLSARA